MYIKTVISVVLLGLAMLSEASGERITGKVYLHDPERLDRARAAQNKFEEARAGMNDLWETLLKNQQNSYKGNLLRLNTSGRIRFEAMLIAIDELKWDEVWSCGQGNCEDVPNFAEFGVTLTDAQKKSIGNQYPEGTTKDRLQESIAEVSTISEEINVLSTKIQSDPDGNKTLAELPSGPVEGPFKVLSMKVSAAAAAVDDGSSNARVRIDELLNAANNVIDKANEVVGMVFSQGSLSSRQTEGILDLLRRKSLIEIIKDDPTREDVLAALQNGPAKTFISKGRETELPKEFQEALSADVRDSEGQPLQVKTVGELLDFLTSDHSDIEEIRLSLLQDMRANLVEIRATRLDGLKAKLNLLQRMVRIRTQQLDIEFGLSRSKQRIERYQDYTSRVVDTLENMHSRYQRSTSTDSRQDVLDEFGDIMLYLAQYTERVGYLRDAEAQLNLEGAALEHRLSIERSRVASLSREAIVARGLDGLVAFSEGGITSNDITVVISFIQTGLLAVIAATN